MDPNMQPNMPGPMPMHPTQFPMMMNKPPMMASIPGANLQAQPHMGMYNMIVPDQNQKKKQFDRGIYVSGFEPNLTSAMLYDHFKIKPIQGLKMPSSKFGESKGFAFIYYGSPDDAAEVKKKLDHSVILKNPIRVVRIVIAENLSKMMLKLKKDIKEDEINDVKARYFNERALEKEVQRIIKPFFEETIEINKIVIPTSKLDKNTTHNYARAFFYVSDVKSASESVKRLEDSETDKEKNNYEIVLNFIVKKLNQNPDFNKYVKAEIYEYSKKNQSNILHFKGLKHQLGQDPAAIAEDLKKTISTNSRQAEVKGCYSNIVKDRGAWANVTFNTFEQTLAVYNLFKDQKVKFRQEFPYASVRNVKDLRTVVISTVRSDVSVKKMFAFLSQLAEKSRKIENTPGRKYDFFSFNIIEAKQFYIDEKNEPVSIQEGEVAEKFWRYNNKVPRRVVVHFMNDIKETDLREFISDIKLQSNWQDIFIEKDTKTPLRANHQKGHINKENRYEKHIDLDGGKKKNKQTKEKTNLGRPKLDDKKKMPGTGAIAGTDLSQFKVGRAGIGAAKIPHAKGNAPLGNKPIGSFKPTFTPKPQTGMPVMGGMNPPPMGSMNQPPMGGMNPPQMGVMPPQMGVMPPQMGGMPPPMGGMMGNKPSMMNQPPPMGARIKSQTPPMMNQPPPMGARIKSQTPPMGFPPQQPKQN